jgi:hypothetical protein
MGLASTDVRGRILPCRRNDVAVRISAMRTMSDSAPVLTDHRRRLSSSWEPTFETTATVVYHGFSYSSRILGCSYPEETIVVSFAERSRFVRFSSIRDISSYKYIERNRTKRDGMEMCAPAPGFAINKG